MKHIRFAAITAMTALATAVAAGSAQAQDVAARCQTETFPEARETCLAVAQALESAQPQLGILLAGGNPTLGTASTGGVRLGILPRVSASLRVNAVNVKVPDILEDASGGFQEVPDEVGIVVPALGANVSLGLTPGFSLAPTLGGFGAIDLLASATWLPVELVGGEGFEDAGGVSWGVGARVGLLRESFFTPGVSLSLMYRGLGTVQVGDVCRQGGGEVDGVEGCLGEGDVGEIRFDLSNWSARAAVSKRLLGLGVTAGVGFDRFDSDGEVAFRAGTVPAPSLPAPARVQRFRDLEVSNDRWSAFVDASYTLLIGSIAAELGWMSGGDAVPNFSSDAFDPGEGTFFGSLGVRLSL